MVIISFLTVVSSILGFFMSSLTAKFFGASADMDAYVAAQTIPDIFLKILQGGILSIVFVPIFVKFLAKKEEKKAWQVTANLLNIMTVFFGGIIFLGVLLTPFLVRLVVPGFSAETKQLTIMLSRVFFPTMLLNMLSVLAISVLNAYKKFSLPAILRLLLPTILIILLFIFKNHFGIAVLAWGTLAATFLQYLVLYIALVKKGLPMKIFFNWRDPILRKLIILIYPFIFATVISQLGSIVDKILASHLLEGSISALFFSNKIIRFVYGTLLTAIPLVSFPSFAEYIAKKDWKSLQKGLVMVFRLISFVILPAMFGLIILRKPIVELLFQRGEFTITDSLMTARALYFYTFGLFATGVTSVLGNLYYVLEKTKTLVKISVIVIIANIILNLLLVGPLQHAGLALATSLVQILSLVLHFWLLLKWIPHLKKTLLDKYILKIFVASAIMGIFTFLFWRILSKIFFAQSLPVQSLKMFLVLSFSVMIYWIISELLEIKEGKEIKSFVGSKAGKLISFINIE